MTTVLAQVREVVRATDDDLDLDPALAACLQLSLAGPRPAPDSPSAPPPRTLSAFGMNLHAETTRAASYFTLAPKFPLQNS